MSSTNKTPKLGLNQWVLTDPFLMEDMNSDNLKIDTAVGMAPYVKLMDVTTSATAAQVDLDVSGIDFTKYAIIQICTSVKATPSGVSGSINTKINGGGGYIRAISSDTNLTSEVKIGSVRVSLDENLASKQLLEFSGFPNDFTAGYYLRLYSSGVGGGNGTYYADEFKGLKTFNAGETITTLNFSTSTSSFSVKAGSQFEIYGVKK